MGVYSHNKQRVPHLLPVKTSETGLELPGSQANETPKIQTEALNMKKKLSFESSILLRRFRSARNGAKHGKAW